jgi:tRNA (pseudouridine54-N1)-methyltransferase
MDEVARVTSTAFTISNGLRRDTELTILFVAEPPPRARRIRLLGTGLRYLNPDERSTAALLKNALVRSSTLEKDVEASPGLVVGPTDPLAALAEFVREPESLWLSESGAPFSAPARSTAGVGVVLSDPDDPTSQEQEVLRREGVRPVSLGPVSLRASQCIDVLHNRWDVLSDGAGESHRLGPDGPMPT